MTNVPDRYCARGEQCTQYPTLGEPTKLNKYHKDTVCERCRREERDNVGESSPSQPATSRPDATEWSPEREVIILKSSAVRQLQALKRELVLQLFSRVGPFWDEVSALRSRRGISPVKRLPNSDEDFHELLSEGAPEPNKDNDGIPNG